MSFLDTLRALVAPGPVGPWGKELVTLSLDDEIAAAVRRRAAGSPVYRIPSVREALSVPAIQRAVSLISGTTGMLTVIAYRNGVQMDVPPRLVVRPNPYEQPGAFYSMTAAQMAKYGEFVWWIASLDSDGQAAALVNVPLHEVSVEEDPRDRLQPIYRWGNIRGLRYSGGNPDGRFVHVKYPLGDPFDLRGRGPLQLAGAATSVSVEAQTWAANFYAKGGYPREIVKKAGILDPTKRDEFGEADPNGLSEAERFLGQYATRDNNTPLIIDENIESIERTEISPGGAQMLEARIHQRGDAALMFSLPGRFVEYVQSGASLTYQNIQDAFTELVKICLAPLYLEPIEQAMSDLLTRSTVARFDVDAFLRADIKTRFEVHKTAIETGVYDAAYAQKIEGIAPGDVEFAPVPFAQPAAVPSALPRYASDGPVRCSGCGKSRFTVLAGETTTLQCVRCKTRNELVAA